MLCLPLCRHRTSWFQGLQNDLCCCCYCCFVLPVKLGCVYALLGSEGPHCWGLLSELLCSAAGSSRRPPAFEGPLPPQTRCAPICGLGQDNWRVCVRHGSSVQKPLPASHKASRAHSQLYLLPSAREAHPLASQHAMPPFVHSSVSSPDGMWGEWRQGSQTNHECPGLPPGLSSHNSWDCETHVQSWKGRERERERESTKQGSQNTHIYCRHA